MDDDRKHELQMDCLRTQLREVTTALRDGVPEWDKPRLRYEQRCLGREVDRVKYERALQ